MYTEPDVSHVATKVEPVQDSQDLDNTFFIGRPPSATSSKSLYKFESDASLMNTDGGISGAIDFPGSVA